ncbi:MAG: Hsp20/alpha crystallin family protein [Pseudomonadota bacterium]
MVGSKSDGPKGFDAIFEIGRRLTQLAEDVQHKFENANENRPEGQSTQHSFTIDTPQGPLTGVAGYSFRFGGLDGDSGGSAGEQGFQEVKKDKSASASQSTASEVREPLIDIYDEDAEILITAELPGIGIDDVKVELLSDVLVIETFGERKFSKNMTLSHKCDPSSLVTSLRNGILEIRLKKIS